MPRKTMYVMCVNNKGNPASLGLGKVYRARSDKEGAKHGYIRVVDESGEGYLYPKRQFVPVRFKQPLPMGARKLFP